MPDYLIILALIGYIVYDRISKAYKEGKLEDKKEAILLIVSYIVVISTIVTVLCFAISGIYLILSGNAPLESAATSLEMMSLGIGVISLITIGMAIAVLIVLCFHMVIDHRKSLK